MKSQPHVIVHADDAAAKDHDPHLQQGVAANIQVLERLAEATTTLTPGLWRTSLLQQSTIGAHVRHITDHYQCYLITHGHLDYDARGRDPGVEQSPQQGRDKIHEVVTRLKQHCHTQGDNSRVNVSASLSIHGEAPAAQSSPMRELMFLQSHTLHHMAIIQVLLAHVGISLDSTFSCAPSTIRHHLESTRHA